MKDLKKVLFTGTLTAIALVTISTYTNAATVKITGEIVNIRKEASADSNVVARLSEDVECEYIGEKGNWYQVKYKNYVGYVSKDYAKVYGKVSQNQNEPNNTPEEQENNTQENNQQTTNNQQVNQENNSQSNNAESTTQTSSEPIQVKNKNVKQNTNIKILPLVHASNIGKCKTSDTVLVLAETVGWSYIQTDEISRLG